MNRHKWNNLLILCGFIVLTGWTDLSSSSRCDEKSVICGPECVATERILNLYGLYATASILISLPRINAVYVLCFSRSNPNLAQQSSDVFCMTGTMDEMQTVQPQHVVTLVGRILNFEEFHEDSSQYVLIHTDIQAVQMYEVIQQDRFYVSFSFVHTLGGQGATESFIIRGFSGSSGVAIATTSGKFCPHGDQVCLAPSVYTLVGESLTQCAAYRSQEQLTADLVTGWNDGTTAYIVFSSPYTDNSPVHGLQLFRLVTVPVGGECHLEFVQDILAGEPICGVRSLEVVRSFDFRTYLLVARQPCPDLQSGQITYTQANVVLKLWDTDSKQFVYSPIARELADTTGVKKITSVSDQFFVSQRESAPSTIHATLLPGGSSVVSTVRVHNHAHIKAVQSRNGDVFLTHVTSVGAVVVDWLSCMLNQQRPSNYSMTPYNSHRAKAAYGRHPFAYRNNTGVSGKALAIPSGSRNQLVGTPYNTVSVPARTGGPYVRDRLDPSAATGDYTDYRYPPSMSNPPYPQQQIPQYYVAPPSGLPQAGPIWYNPPSKDAAPQQPYTVEAAEPPPSLYQAVPSATPAPPNQPALDAAQAPQQQSQYNPPDYDHLPQQLTHDNTPTGNQLQVAPAPAAPPFTYQPQPAPYISPPVYYQNPPPGPYRSQPQPYYGMYGPTVSQAVPYYHNLPPYSPPVQQATYPAVYPYTSNLVVTNVNPNYPSGPRTIPVPPQPLPFAPVPPVQAYNPPFVPPFPYLAGQPRTTAIPPTTSTAAADTEAPEPSPRLLVAGNVTQINSSTTQLLSSTTENPTTSCEIAPGDGANSASQSLMKVDLTSPLPRLAVVELASTDATTALSDQHTESVTDVTAANEDIGTAMMEESTTTTAITEATASAMPVDITSTLESVVSGSEGITDATTTSNPLFLAIAGKTSQATDEHSALAEIATTVAPSSTTTRQVVIETIGQAVTVTETTPVATTEIETVSTTLPELTTVETVSISLLDLLSASTKSAESVSTAVGSMTSSTFTTTAEEGVSTSSNLVVPTETATIPAGASEASTIITSTQDSSVSRPAA